MIFSTVLTVRDGLTRGMVIRQSLSQKPAPSTVAASYRDPSIDCRPESTQKVTNGIVTKMPTQHSHTNSIW